MTTASADDGADPAALARGLPDSVDAELVRARLMTAMFGRAAGSPRFGRFELRERIGQGGMGVVYRAFDPQLERTVAIKLIDTRGFATSLRERALREARSLARLAHPNVITVFEAGLTDDRVWIAMEYVPGTTMRDYLTRTPRPEHAAILRHWIAVGRGLVAVHAAGLVHRDVKPSNVLIGDDGRARLIDFGLVHAPRGEPEAIGGTRESGAGSEATGHTAAFVGTRAYAAPEQLAGREVDAAADQYSLCVAIRESLAERMPTSEAGVATIAGVSPRITRALARGLSPEPRARFGELAELLAELEAAVAGPRRRLGLMLGAAVLGALVSGGAAWQLFAVPEPPPCAVDPDALAGTWDEARSAALRERLTAGSLEFAPTTLATLNEGLDAWAREWHEARHAACAATRIEGVQSDAALDLRNACLERKRRSVQVALETLLGEDGALSLAARAPELLASLPALGDCSDPERLAQIEPLPAEGPAREAVVRGHDVLARAGALAAAGALGRAQASVDEFVADGDAPSYAPLRLELDAFPARLELLREQTSRGIPGLVAVAREAEARRLDELAATLLVEAADAAAGHWSKPELERWLVDEAGAALRRLDRPADGRTVALTTAEADLLAQTGRFADALALYERARTLALELGDVDRAAAQALNIAAMLEELGRFDDARAALEGGLAAARRRWGDGAPLVGTYEGDLGLLALETGDFEIAESHLERAEQIFGAAFGDSLPVARVRFARAKLYTVRGEFASALAQVEGAFAIHVERLGPEHEQLADLHEVRGVLRYFTGDLPGSIDAYRAALQIQTRIAGAEHPTVARLHSNLGESQLALERLDDAQESFDRALTIHGRTLPEDHPDIALPLKGRGQVALARGQARRAVPDLQRALALQLKAGSEPLEIADLRFSLARALAASEGAVSQQARELARQARADYEGRDMREQVAAIDAWSKGQGRSQRRGGLK